MLTTGLHFAWKTKLFQRLLWIFDSGSILRWIENSIRRIIILTETEVSIQSSLCSNHRFISLKRNFSRERVQFSLIQTINPNPTTNDSLRKKKDHGFDRWKYHCNFSNFWWRFKIWDIFLLFTAYIKITKDNVPLHWSICLSIYQFKEISISDFQTFCKDFEKTKINRSKKKKKKKKKKRFNVFFFCFTL